jgi:L-rhamnose mutarotase
MIATARYTGKSRYSFDSYIARHQKAHNELFTLGEVLSESKKVQDFLRGIEDSSFATFKGIVLGDNTKLENFELCQQYLKTCSNVLQTAQASSNKRTVASTRFLQNPSLSGRSQRDHRPDPRNLLTMDIIPMRNTGR